MADYDAHARAILARTSFVVLATADPSGTPWATPVWYAADGLDRLYWLSWPGSRHSVLIETRSAVALTVFDSSVAPGEGTAFYASARARQCESSQLADALAVINVRARSQGLEEFGLDRVTASARLRVYVAEVEDAWVLDPDAAVDQRARVPRA